MHWAYGVTTTPERFPMLVERTLPSLRDAGFENPRLFIDFKEEAPIPEKLQKYQTTTRQQNMGIVGNWILAMWELRIREPHADRYALFQDDFVTYRNLRQYLEKVPYPSDGYLNLYTFPENEKLAAGRKGFYRSNQLGKGAVALVFDRDNISTILTHPHLIQKVQCPKRGKKSLDGGVVTAAKLAKRYEYVHSPSLVQHIGDRSSMGNRKHAHAVSFQGEGFDALHLLSQPASPVSAPPQVTEGPGVVPPHSMLASPGQASDLTPPEKQEGSMQLGIVGPCCDTERSSLLRQIASSTPGTKWLVTPDAHLSVPLPEGIGLFTGRTVNDFRSFFRAIDVLIFNQEPLNNMILPLAGKYNVPVIYLDVSSVGTGTENFRPIPRWMHYVDRVVHLDDWTYKSWSKSGVL